MTVALICFPHQNKVLPTTLRANVFIQRLFVGVQTKSLKIHTHTYGIEMQNKHRFRYDGCNFFFPTNDQECTSEWKPRKISYTAWVIQEQRFERVCQASQSVTSRKALDDTEGIWIKSEFSKTLTRFASVPIQSMERCTSTFPFSGYFTALPSSGP